jgi:putative redox protein
MSREVRVQTDPAGKFRQTLLDGPHHLISDEPVDAGGDDAGPSPHELLLLALGSCTSMTLKLYADRKGWPLRSAEVRLTLERVRREAPGPTGDAVVIHRTIQLEGDLDADQRQRLLEIAGKCPVHKTLTGEIDIRSVLA